MYINKFDYMADNRQKLVHLHTSDVKMPAQGLLDLGEIAVQHNDVEAALYIEKNNGEIAKFIDVTAVEAKINVEKLRAEGAEEALTERIDVLSDSNHTHENKDVLDGINSDKVAAWDKAVEDVKALTVEISDNERVVATALNQLNESAGFDENGKSLLPGNISLTAAILDVTEKVNTLEGSNHTHENKDVLDGITAEKVAAWDAAEANAIADAEAKYQVKGDYEAAGAAAQALADAKADAEAKYQVKGDYEAAGAAAQALADAKADAAELYQVKGEYEAAGAAAAVETKLNTHKEDTVAHITEQERTDWNAAKTAIDTFLKDADMTEKAVDTLAELQTYMETDGAAATELVNRVSALESINHDAYIAADAQVLTDAKSYVDGKVDGKFDEAGAAAQALADAKADAAELYQVKGDYEAAGAAAQALTDAKAYVDGKVDGKFDEAGAAAQALADAKADAEAKYQVKGEYEAAGAAAQALVDAKAYSDGNLATAKAYVDGKVDGKFDEVGAAAQALTDAKTYTDEKLAVIKIDCGTY